MVVNKVKHLGLEEGQYLDRQEGQSLGSEKGQRLSFEAENTQTIGSQLCTRGALGCSRVLLVWAAEGVQFSIVL